MSHSPLLEVRDLTAEFFGLAGNLRVLDGCNLRINEGEIHGIIGAGSSGKSVLTRCVLNLLPPPGQITGGEVLYQGRNLLSLPEDDLQRLRGQLCLLPPNGRSLLNPTTTVGSQISLMLKAHRGTSASDSNEMVHELLKRVGIPNPERWALAYPHELSGGMAQRAVVALGLSCSPRMLIADEMTANLDVTVQAQVLDALRLLVDEEGLTVLYVTRDVGIVAHYCTTVSVLDKGQVTENQSVRDFFRRPQSKAGEEIVQSGALLAGRPASASNRANETRLRDWDRRELKEAVLGMTSDNEGLLQVDNLVKRYRSPRTRDIVHAVNGVNLHLDVGETLGLVGESGSGKTTVGRCILGLVEPDEGMITIVGENVSRRKAVKRGDLRRTVQLVFQDPYESLNPRWTIRRSISDPLHLLLGLRGRELEHSIRDQLRLVGLTEDVLDRFPHELTGGAQQLVGIARAMASRPRILVLDEPTSRLDAPARARVIGTLRRIQEETGVAYLFISHDLVAVKGMATRLAVMYLGLIVEEGEAEDVFANPMHPYTAALLSAVLDPNPDAFMRRFALMGEISSAVSLPSGCVLHPRCPVAVEDCARSRPELKERGLARRRTACARTPTDARSDWNAFSLLPSGASADGTLERRVTGGESAVWS